MAFFVALAFSLWPQIAKATGTGWAWTVVFVSFGTMVAGFSFSLKSAIGEGWPSQKVAVVLIIFAILNGFGFSLYAKTCADVAVNTPVFMVIMIVMMIVLTPVLSMLLFQQSISSSQWGGVALAVVAVWLLGR